MNRLLKSIQFLGWPVIFGLLVALVFLQISSYSNSPAKALKPARSHPFNPHQVSPMLSLVQHHLW